MKPLFSIITVCHNEARAIRKTCESVVGQAYGAFEWVVIDGASTDGTLNILDEFRQHMSHLVSEPDEGLFHAMNKGIALTRGEYLVFMNGGDCFASNHALNWVAECPMADLIYGDTYHDSLDGALITYPDHLPRGYLLRHQLPHQATYYKRSLFDKFGGYDTRYRIAADYDLHVRLLEVAKVSHHHVAKPLAIFNLTGISSSSTYRMLRKSENHAVRMKYFPIYRWTPKAWRQSIRHLISGTP